jgi:hypothetical protein
VDNNEDGLTSYQEAERIHAPTLPSGRCDCSAGIQPTYQFYHHMQQVISGTFLYI